MSRRHRGPHPDDAKDFTAPAVPRLRLAVDDLSLLLGRGYVNPSALKLVGDRYRLTRRQRKAIERSTCAPKRAEARRDTRVESVRGKAVYVDGFNAVIVGESLLSGAPVFRGLDDALRDLASVHGTWRRVAETEEVVCRYASALAEAASVAWLLDRPVSNSGRLRALIQDVARARGLPWTADLVPDPDRALADCPGVVASADGAVIDATRGWMDLARAVIGPGAWVIDLRPQAVTEDQAVV